MEVKTLRYVGLSEVCEDCPDVIHSFNVLGSITFGDSDKTLLRARGGRSPIEAVEYLLGVALPASTTVTEREFFRQRDVALARVQSLDEDVYVDMEG